LVAFRVADSVDLVARPSECRLEVAAVIAVAATEVDSAGVIEGVIEGVLVLVALIHRPF